MKPSELPAPDTIIEGSDGQFWPLMFHFAAEGHRYDELANEAGFDTKFSTMENELDPDHPLIAKHFDQGENALSD